MLDMILFFFCVDIFLVFRFSVGLFAGAGVVGMVLRTGSE